MQASCFPNSAFNRATSRASVLRGFDICEPFPAYLRMARPLIPSDPEEPANPQARQHDLAKMDHHSRACSRAWRSPTWSWPPRDRLSGGRRDRVHSRARRYANYKGGKKYDKNHGYKKKVPGTGDPDKIKSAAVFYEVWKRAEADPRYAARKEEWKVKFG
jgi:Domain of unknown function (DUF4385)